MSMISSVTNEIMKNFSDKVKDYIAGYSFLEEAAQKFTDLLYDEYKESIVLARLFATVPFEKLPAANQAFVNKLAASQKISHLINNQTLVLSLLGTHGAKAAWNDRHHSQGHVGIPLASADFINAIPMMSRLLKELGLNLKWIESNDSEVVAKTIGKMAGLFYVPDAKTSLDHKGRKIIAAQDYVAANNVKTVFGFGGGYMLSTTFITIIIFTREMIEKNIAEKFLMLVNLIKTATLSMVREGKIFTA